MSFFYGSYFSNCIFYDYTSNIFQAKNSNKYLKIYLVDTGTNKEDILEDKAVTYISKDKYHKPKQKYIHLEDLKRYL